MDPDIEGCPWLDALAIAALLLAVAAGTMGLLSWIF